MSKAVGILELSSIAKGMETGVLPGESFDTDKSFSERR